MLARAGGFDQLDPNRRRVFEALDALVSYSAAIHEQKASNQVSLFGEAGDDLPEPRIRSIDDWPPIDRLMEEQKAIGFFLTGHPLDDYAGPLRRKKVKTIAQARDEAEASGAAIVSVGVMVSGFREMKSLKGNRYFRMNISDSTGQLAGIAMFARKEEDLIAARNVLENTDKVVMSLEARFNEGQFDPTIRSVAAMDSVIADAGSSGLEILIDDVAVVQNVANILAGAREAARGAGRGPVSFRLIHPDLPGEVEIDTQEQYPVNPQIKGAIKGLNGVLDVEEV